MNKNYTKGAIMKHVTFKKYLFQIQNSLNNTFAKYTYDWLIIK